MCAQSCPTLCDPMDYIARQAPLSMEFSRQEYQSGLPFPPPRDLPNPRIKPASLESPALAGGYFTAVPPGNPQGLRKWYGPAALDASIFSFQIFCILNPVIPGRRRRNQLGIQGARYPPRLISVTTSSAWMAQNKCQESGGWFPQIPLDQHHHFNHPFLQLTLAHSGTQVETLTSILLQRYDWVVLCALILHFKKVLTYLTRFSLNSLTAWFGKHFLAATQYSNLKYIAINNLGVSHFKKEEGKQAGRKQR